MFDAAMIPPEAKCRKSAESRNQNWSDVLQKRSTSASSSSTINAPAILLSLFLPPCYIAGRE